MRALDVGGEITGLPHLELLAHVRLGIEAADLLDLDVLAGVQQLDLDAGAQFAVENPHVGNHALVGVEIGIEAQCLKRGRAGGLRRRDSGDNCLEDFVYADALLGAGENRGVAGDGEDVFQLGSGLRDVGVRQVNLVDDGDDREVLLGQVA